MADTGDAMNATLTPLCYELDDKCPSAWPASVSLTVVASYPFLNAPSDETPSDFVVRAYLETLWMPEVSSTVLGTAGASIFYTSGRGTVVLTTRLDTIDR